MVLVWVFEALDLEPGLTSTVKCKVIPYFFEHWAPAGADHGVQAVSPQVTLSHPPGSRLLLLSARPVVTLPAEERHHPSVGIKLYCLVTEAYWCEQLAQGCYLVVDQLRFEPAVFWVASERSTITIVLSGWFAECHCVNQARLCLFYQVICSGTLWLESNCSPDFFQQIIVSCCVTYAMERTYTSIFYITGFD